MKITPTYARNLLLIRSFEGLKEDLNLPIGRLSHYALPRKYKFVNNPREVANYLYGGKWGNKEPNDGYKYIGRGYIKIRGRDNYQKLQDAFGIPFVEQPELLEEREVAWYVASIMFRPWLDDILLKQYYTYEMQQAGLEYDDIPEISF